MLTSLYPAAALGSPGPPGGRSSPTGSSEQVRHTAARVSAYDNLSGLSASGSGSALAGELPEEGVVDAVGEEFADDSSDDGTVTEFSEPWDSNRWDELLSSPSNK